MGFGKLRDRIRSDAIRPFNPNPKAHDVFGLLDKKPDATSAPNAGYPSIYPGGFPATWGKISPMPAVNPLAQARWYTPTELDNLMAFNGSQAMGQSERQTPAGLALGSFMARLNALYGGGNGGA